MSAPNSRLPHRPPHTRRRAARTRASSACGTSGSSRRLAHPSPHVATHHPSHVCAPHARSRSRSRTRTVTAPLYSICTRLDLHSHPPHPCPSSVNPAAMLALSRRPRHLRCAQWRRRRRGRRRGRGRTTPTIWTTRTRCLTPTGRTTRSRSDLASLSHLAPRPRPARRRRSRRLRRRRSPPQRRRRHHPNNAVCRWEVRRRPTEGAPPSRRRRPSTVPPPHRTLGCCRLLSGPVSSCRHSRPRRLAQRARARPVRLPSTSRPHWPRASHRRPRMWILGAVAWPARLGLPRRLHLAVATSC